MAQPNRREAIGLSAAMLAAGKLGGWKPALVLDNKGNTIAGDGDELCAAIRRGADLRIYTEFLYNEHVDTKSDNSEIVQEVSEFHITYLLDDRWAAGIMTQRQPIEPPIGFGPRPSMSLFLYNQNGRQAIARPYLDGIPPTGTPGPSPAPDVSQMPKNHMHDRWDGGTIAPSTNFTYDFERYQFFVRDDWHEVLSHGPDGTVVSGSAEAVGEASARGAEVKVAVRGLCAELADRPTEAMDHEVFVQAGWNYYHTGQKLFVAALHPLVRVAPAIPLAYHSRGWDLGWFMVRSDGYAARWMVDPYTLKFTKSDARYALRWFVR